MPGLPTPAPTVTEEARPFWEAAGRGRLLAPRCVDCSAVVWYPRSFCPECHGRETEWCELSGRGTVYSFTINRTGRADHAAYRGAAPYVLAYVELVEGPRMLTNVVGCEPDEVRCGLPVRAVFSPVADDSGPVSLVRFAPDPR